MCRNKINTCVKFVKDGEYLRRPLIDIIHKDNNQILCTIETDNEEIFFEAIFNEQTDIICNVCSDKLFTKEEQDIIKNMFKLSSFINVLKYILQLSKTKFIYNVT